MLSVIMMSVIMLIVVMLSAMLRVVVLRVANADCHGAGLKKFIKLAGDGSGRRIRRRK
jgi:hypothetical protein